MRVLALDLGDRRIGVAISDTLGMLARPLETFKRGSRVGDFAHIRALIDEHHVQKVVAGLPLNMDGTEGKQATWVRDYTTELAEAISLPVVLWDERLSSTDARSILGIRGRPTDRGKIDAVAAAVILRSYLDAQEGTPSV